MLDLTATVQPPGQREAEIVIDEDGYTELRYWNQPGAGPAQISAPELRPRRHHRAAAANAVITQGRRVRG
jgi:hypothetical protein